MNLATDRIRARNDELRRIGCGKLQRLDRAIFEAAIRKAALDDMRGQRNVWQVLVDRGATWPCGGLYVAHEAAIMFR